jgi:hypothetical protein
MRARGHAVRHNLEMSGGNLVGGALLIGALALGAFPPAGVVEPFTLAAVMCGPLCLIMFIVMAARFDHYGGRLSAVAVGGPESGVYTCSMHLEIRMDTPGRCPVCGMALIRRA